MTNILSQRINLGLPMFDADQNIQHFSFEDMTEAFKLGIKFVFSSTDDYFQQIVELEDALIEYYPATEKLYSRKQFKEMVSSAMDVFAFTRRHDGHEETIKVIIECL